MITNRRPQFCLIIRKSGSAPCRWRYSWLHSRPTYFFSAPSATCDCWKPSRWLDYPANTEWWYWFSTGHVQHEWFGCDTALWSHWKRHVYIAHLGTSRWQQQTVHESGFTDFMPRTAPSFPPPWLSQGICSIGGKLQIPQYSQTVLPMILHWCGTGSKWWFFVWINWMLALSFTCCSTLAFAEKKKGLSER